MLIKSSEASSFAVGIAAQPEMNWVYRIVYILAHAAWKLLGNWEVIGAENLPKVGPVILCPNHNSYLDPPLIGAAVDRECAYIARHDLWKSRVFRWFLLHLNAIPVNREKPEKSTFKLSLEALEKGMPLVIFPEGTRSVDGNLNPAGPGVALIAQKSGAPVLPVALIGPEVMLPPGAKRPHRTKLKVVFGTVLRFDKSQDRDKIAEEIMNAIGKLVKQHRN